MPRRALTTAVAIGGVLAAASAASATADPGPARATGAEPRGGLPVLHAPRPLVIRSIGGGARFSIAGWGTQSGLRGAVARFGPPSSRRPVADGLGCWVRWQRLGLLVIFANFGGKDPCTASGGRAQQVTAYGRRWRTQRGLAIGDRRARVRARYPLAVRARGEWALVRRSQFGNQETVLAVRLSRGRVARIVASPRHAGD